ncbi:MAG: hypothetical protein ACYS99_22925, partial [Planctomycetota bacterium]
MADGARDQTAAIWIKKATWRLSECEAEIHKLSGSEERGRRRKLRTRADRYRALLDHLRAEAKREDPDRLRQLEEEFPELERELAGLKERIAATAGSLLTAKARIRELKTRWGRLADEIMRERESRGLPPGRVDTLDFGFPPPAAGASR